MIGVSVFPTIVLVTEGGDILVPEVVQELVERFTLTLLIATPSIHPKTPVGC